MPLTFIDNWPSPSVVKEYLESLVASGGNEIPRRRRAVGRMFNCAYTVVWPIGGEDLVRKVIGAITTSFPEIDADDIEVHVQPLARKRVVWSENDKRSLAAVHDGHCHGCGAGSLEIFGGGHGHLGPIAVWYCQKCEHMTQLIVPGLSNW